MPRRAAAWTTDRNNSVFHFHLGLAYASAGASARQTLQRAIELKLPAEHLDEATRVLARLM